MASMMDRALKFLGAILALMGLGFLLGRRSRQSEVEESERKAKFAEYKHVEAEVRRITAGDMARRSNADLIRTVGATGRADKPKPEPE